MNIFVQLYAISSCAELDNHCNHQEMHMFFDLQTLHAIKPTWTWKHSKLKIRKHQMPARMWTNRSTYTLLVEMQTNPAILKVSVWVSYKTDNRSSMWSATSRLLLGIYTSYPTSAYNRDACTSVFCATLVPVPKLWSHPRCPTIEKWVGKLIYREWNFYPYHTVEQLCHLLEIGYNWSYSY